jgi:hypothetical protein
LFCFFCFELRARYIVVVEKEKANQFRIVSIGWRQKDWRQSSTDVWHDDIFQKNFIVIVVSFILDFLAELLLLDEMGHPIDYRLRVTFNSFPSIL